MGASATVGVDGSIRPRPAPLPPRRPDPPSPMNATFLLDRTARELRDADGRCFDTSNRGWAAKPSGMPGDAVETIDAVAAVAWLQRESQHPLRLPIAVIGPPAATTAQFVAAMQVGELLADCGLATICAGGHGLAQALCDGVKRVGGVTIGVLPGVDPAAANGFVSVILATGIGETCDALIVQTAFCVIAVGDSPAGVAHARAAGKLVVVLAGEAPGHAVVHAADARAAVEAVALAVLGLTPGR
jgi:uncharacterized protein (TIGR00725 family)